MDRQLYLQDFKKYLAQTPLVLLKHKGKGIEYLTEDADIDLFVKDKTEAQQLLQWVRSHAMVQSMKIHRSDSVWYILCLFTDGGFLQIDLLFSLSRKSLQYLSREAIEKGIVQKADGCKASDYLMFCHVILFNYLNYSGIPKGYVQYFEALPARVQKQLLQTFNTAYHTNFTSIRALEGYAPQARIQMLRQLKKEPCNSPLARLGRMGSYLKNFLYRIRYKRGWIATYSGIDGAGKSTILEKSADILAKKYRLRVHHLRHRPGILPILSSFLLGKKKAEQQAAHKLPRQGHNKSRISSLLRFAYYYTDYLLGQIYIYLRYVLLGYVVLYDRYYFDFIVDGKRSNIILNQQLTHFLYRFIHHPAINFFLYADADIILKRKKELPARAIKELTANYMHLFTRLNTRHKGAYLPIENVLMEDTLTRVEQAFQNQIFSSQSAH
jgi:thymidylate kinase